MTISKLWTAGVDVKAEEMTYLGRSDLVMEHQDRVYIPELKKDAASHRLVIWYNRVRKKERKPMDFLRVIKNSKDLEKIMIIPKELKNRKVEVLILPFSEQDDSSKKDHKILKGILSKYKNSSLRSKENDAWSKAVIDQYEHH